MGAMDAVLLLSKGRRVYYGAVAGVAPYFATRLGYAMPFGMNPADFILDLANGDTSACAGGGGGFGKASSSSSSVSAPISAAEDVLESPDEVVARLTKACAGQIERIDEKGNERAPLAPDGLKPAGAAVTAVPAAASRGTDVLVAPASLLPPSSSRAPQTRWACPWHEQTALLLARSFATRRGQLLDTLKLSQVVLVALMVGRCTLNQVDP